MVYEAIFCPACHLPDAVYRPGKTPEGIQRYRCQGCGSCFQLSYFNRACLPGTRERITEMALNGSGIRDTARVLGIATSTVLNQLKKKSLT